MNHIREKFGSTVNADPTPDALNEEALATRLGGGRVEVERVAGGQSNPTFFVEHKGNRLVLRMAPIGNTLPSAHAVDREFRIQNALSRAGFPVPEPVFLEEDPAVLGAPFYVMKRIDGVVFADSEIPGKSPEFRKTAYRNAARTMARLHALDWKAAGLEGFGREGAYFQRQISRWTKQWRFCQTRDDNAVEALIDALPRLIPADNRTTVAHGDFRIGNIIFSPKTGKIAAVLDWELSTLGHPMADIAHFAMLWELTSDQLGGVAGLDLEKLGIPDRTDFICEYRKAGGCELELQPFHRAFALFRYAVIFEGIVAREKSGCAAAADAKRVGALSAEFAEKAVSILCSDKHI